MDKTISIYGKKLFEYSSPKGMIELINVLTKHLINFQIFTKPENIFITNGSQQALYILGVMPFPSSKLKILVEQPTYSVMLNILENAKIPVIGIKRTNDGIDLNTSILTQGELEVYLKSSMYKFHVRRTKEFYRNKMGILRKLCNKNLNDKITWYIPDTGLYAYMEVKEVSSHNLENNLLNSKILVSSTNNSYIEGFKHTEGIRLCVCNASEEEIIRAVNVINMQ
ncbi:valine--pyruvate transaminase [Clostridium puniceum]|uniref:Valine--pyruvate transaminase n=1 Tax=Clostridium puniceum TaxID=29367 RepID=A0A1S8TGE0_9CLOT|nr:aminotransferase class I/II-fold pyridoxal phosphate-dependent enzyme [Clostridium puniceum]OOM76689.1 valine--pyruvate transaminase [Clostridium puniceum]